METPAPVTNGETREPQPGAATPDAARPGRPKPLYRRCWFRVARVAVIGYVAWYATLYFYQDRMLFPADLAPPPMPGAPRNTTVLTIPADGGGKVEAWLLPAPNANADRPAPLVIYFHGNAELIDFQDEIAGGYRRLGFAVLLPEYRGYGRSAGRPSQTAIVADAVQFLDEALKRPDVDRARVVIHGRSVGGGVAAQVAARRRPAAMILESTFTSIGSMARGYGGPAFLARHPFRTDRILPTLNVPLLLFHGTRDSIIPVAHGRKLHALVPQATYVEYDCDHNDFPGRGNDKAYWQTIERFLTVESRIARRP